MSITTLDEQVKMAEDQPSIGLILCKDRNTVVAEYALRDVGKPIGIARYALSATLPDELKASLPTAEEVEAELGKIDAGGLDGVVERQEIKKVLWKQKTAPRGRFACLDRGFCNDNIPKYGGCSVSLLSS